MAGRRHRNLAIEHPQARRVGVQPKDAVLRQRKHHVLPRQGYQLVLALGRHLQDHRARKDLDARARERARSQADRAVLADAQERSRIQQNLDPSLLRAEHVLHPHLGKPGGRDLDVEVVQEDLPLGVVDHAGLGGDDGLRQRARRAQPSQDQVRLNITADFMGNPLPSILLLNLDACQQQSVTVIRDALVFLIDNR